MPRIIKIPGGRVIEFPDGMNDDDIADAIDGLLADTAKSPPPVAEVGSNSTSRGSMPAEAFDPASLGLVEVKDDEFDPASLGLVEIEKFDPASLGTVPVDGIKAPRVAPPFDSLVDTDPPVEKATRGGRFLDDEVPSAASDSPAALATTKRTTDEWGGTLIEERTSDSPAQLASFKDYAAKQLADNAGPIALLLIVAALIAAAVVACVRIRRWIRQLDLTWLVPVLRENAKWLIISIAVVTAVLLHALTSRYGYVNAGRGEVLVVDRWTGKVEEHR